MLQLSKIDEVAIAVAQINEQNPLSEINISVDIAKIVKRDPELMEFDDSGKTMKIKEELLDQEIRKIF